MTKLPPGWARVDLGALVSVSRPRVLPADSPDLPYIGLEHVESQTGRLLGTVPARSMKSTAFHFSPGDILYGRLRPYLNKVYLANEEGLCSSEFIVMSPGDALVSSFLAHRLRHSSFVEFANQQNQGDRPRVSFGQLAAFPILLPPKKEQVRIVKKLEEFADKLDVCREHLDKVPARIGRFRQAVLMSACSGRLTADWRRKNRIASKAGEGRETLPVSWERVKFEELCTDITVGHVGPTAKEYVPSGIPFLRSMNVRRFKFETAGLRFVSKDFHRRLSKSKLGPGDLVIVRSGNAGMACVIPPSLREANCADLIVVRCGAKLNPSYACIFVNSSEMQSHIDQVKVGIAQAHFNIGEMRKSFLALPTPPEQEEIVRRVEALFGLSDQVESRYLSVESSLEQLAQSILAKAFRGELAHQDSGDESAAKLLERVRALDLRSLEASRG